MYCSKCGTELPEGGKYCPKCGTEVHTNLKTKINNVKTAKQISQEESSRIKKNTLDDKVTDFIASKIAGEKIETIRISMEDMVELLKEHFIAPASTDSEYKEIQKAVNGSGWGGVKIMSSKDGNYELRVSIVMQLGGRMDILHPGDSNWCRVYDNTSGKIYQYSSFTWGKFKKAVENAINAARNS